MNSRYLNIPGYLPIIRKDRAGHGGGIALYVANYCAVKRLIHFELPELGILPFSILFVIVLMTTRAANSVECLLRKPYCPS